MSEILGLKNVNMLSKEQYEGISEVATDELYAVATETYSDDDGNWYRVYPDGWCEQGGVIDNVRASSTKNFIKPYKTKPTVLVTELFDYNSTNQTIVRTISTTNFVAYTDHSASYVIAATWYSCGYIAE